MNSLFVLPLAGVLALVLPSPQQATPTSAALTPVPDEPARAPLSNTLMDGTTISLRLSETVSSADAHTGQQVPFEVTEDVVVQGVTVIAKGTAALATVTDAESKKRMGRGGKLDVNIDSTRLINGDKIQLRATKNTKGGGHIGVMTGAIVATSIVFFPAAPLFLFMHGKDITIPKGTVVTAFVQGDTKLDMARIQSSALSGTHTAAQGISPASASPASTSSTTAASVATASLQIESNISGADIEIDGAFVGNTPSTLNVIPGPHKIMVKKKGYADWSRTMAISGSAVHLSASLDSIKQLPHTPE